MGTLNMTGKHIKYLEDLAISYDQLQYGSPMNFDDFDILASYSNKFR